MRPSADVLSAIRDRDPDGHATRPTDEAYANFRRWVLRTHGHIAWRAYHMSGH